MSEITRVIGRSVWDSRGRPTVEVEVHTRSGAMGRAIAPAGASTGSGEALDLRDGGRASRGYGVNRAVENVNQMIAPMLCGLDVTQQTSIDHALVALDGTPQRQRLGGNAMIATSLAIAHAAAADSNQPLWSCLASGKAIQFPTPEVQIFGGGAHAQGHMDLQDFMVVPHGASSFREAMEWVAEVYLAAGDYMDAMGRRMGVADEGGYWPAFDSNEAAIEALVSSIENAGFSTRGQIGVSLDIAATQIYREGAYHLKKESKALSPDAWYELMLSWVKSYPIIMIEDPFVETDMVRHAELFASMPKGVQLVGDDLLVTQVSNMSVAAQYNACNTLLCKPNQVGTLSEALAAHQQALANGWSTVMSARSGETEDVSIVHLALGWNIPQFKVGSFARSERMAKWNEMLRIEDTCGKSTYAGYQPWEALQ